MNAFKTTRDGQIWLIYWNMLLEYYRREGHCEVPDFHTEDGIALGKWVHRQRSYRFTLKKDQRAALENIDGWFWEEAKNSTQNEANNAVGLYQPSVQQSAAGQKRSRRRTNPNKRRGGRNRVKSAALWDKYFLALQSYCEREGTSRIRSIHYENGLLLGPWASDQRLLYRRGELSVERQDKLQRIPNWEWEKEVVVWSSGLRLLEKYYSREGTIAISSTHLEEGVALNSWANWQRMINRHGRLTAEKQRTLEEFHDWNWGPNNKPFVKDVKNKELLNKNQPAAFSFTNKVPRKRIANCNTEAHKTKTRHDKEEKRSEKLRDKMAREAWAALVGVGLMN